MKLVGGMWMPDVEEHMVQWMHTPKNKRVVNGRIQYQYTKQEFCWPHIRNWRTAVDIGAHVGFWSINMIPRFQQLHAFEPVAEHRACWAKNIFSAYPDTKAQLYPVALGEKEGSVSLRMCTPHSTGNTKIVGEGDIPLKRLDDYMLSDVDFMKLDCEGYELFALRGAEETLRRCHPCIIVEQKPGRAQDYGLGQRDAIPYLESLGAKLRKEYSGDFILTWDN